MSYARSISSRFFFFNDTATTEIYTLSLHDALPISGDTGPNPVQPAACDGCRAGNHTRAQQNRRSEEHTSELQSPYDLVCRLLLEKKKYKVKYQLRREKKKKIKTKK